jgi:DNA-binding transcriptional ArsR family regulator
LRTSVLVVENTIATDLMVGRSSVRRRILSLLMAEPAQRLHLREIQRRALTSPGTASRELTRLVAAGLVERQAEGNQVYFQPASSAFAVMVRSVLFAPFDDTPEPEPEPAPLVPAAGQTAPETTRPPRTIRAAVSTQKGRARPDAFGLMVAARLAEVLRPLYTGRLAGIFLYGGRARGEPKQDADVEVVVVLDSIGRYGDELERTSATCAGLSLEYSIVVSRVFVSKDVWLSRTDGHLLAIRAEAVAV